MRPGHPVLFAFFDQNSECFVNDNLANPKYIDQPGDLPQGTAIFALPGNPIAAAATFRFLVMPYILALQDMREDNGIKAKAQLSLRPKIHCKQETVGASYEQLTLSNRRPNLDYFCHGKLQFSEDGDLLIEINAEQSPARTRPFAWSNCWVHVPSGHGDVRDGDVLACFSLSGEPLNICD